MARKIPVFPHQTGATISIDNATEGDYPNVRVILFNSDETLQSEQVPIVYIGEYQATDVVINLQGGGKSGYIIIG